MKELQNENGHFEEEACSLFDKVNSNDCDTCIANALFAIKFPKLNVDIFFLVDES